MTITTKYNLVNAAYNGSRILIDRTTDTDQSSVDGCFLKTLVCTVITYTYDDEYLCESAIPTVIMESSSMGLDEMNTLAMAWINSRRPSLQYLIDKQTA